MDNLIYDRTQLDVIELTSKAYYNYTDLNRIEQWCKYISDLLIKYGYKIHLDIKTDWTNFDFPYKSEMERIRNNVKKLKQAYTSFTNVPSNLDNMTWQKANDIERILHEIDYILKWMENNFIYSGVGNVGNNRVWQQRFRRKNSYFKLKLWNELTETYWNELENKTWEGVGMVATNYEL